MKKVIFCVIESQYKYGYMTPQKSEEKFKAGSSNGLSKS